MADLLNNVKQNLRAVTQSCKEGVHLQHIASDYHNLVGEPIQFRKLGFKSLEEMLVSMPDVVHITRDRGQLMVKAVPTASTQHITDLVANQRSNKSKTVARNRPLKNSNQGPPLIPSYPPRYYPHNPTSRGGARRNAEVPPRFQQHQRRRQQAENLAPLEPLGAGGDTWAPSYTPLTVKVPLLPIPPPPLLPLPPQLPPAPKKKKPTPPKPPVPTPKSSKAILLEWADKNKVSVTYSSQVIGIKSDVRSETSLVTVGDKKYSSFPHHAATVQEAEEIATQKAMTALNILQESSVLPTTKVETPEDIESLQTRIVELLTQDKTNCGVWNSLVEELYTKNHNEQLPEDWLKHAGTCPNISVDRIDDHRSILKYVAQMKRKPSEGEESVGPVKEIPPIHLPQSNNWDVQLVYVPQGSHVAIHLVDYLERFEQLCDRMNAHYAEKGEPVGEKLEVDQLYALSVEGNWHRMLCTNILDNNKAELYFVDYGDTTKMDISKCYVLEPEFYELPYQAIWCTLKDLEDYANDKDCQTILSSYISSVLIAKVSNLNTSYPPFLPFKEIQSRDNFMVEVVLFDTSTDDDINVNELVKTKVNQSRLTPKMPEVGHFQDVIPRYLTNSGYLYFSIPGPGITELDKLMEEVNLKAPELVGKVKQIDKREIYCAKFEDDYFYRAVVTDHDDSLAMVDVFYIDFGNDATVPYKDLVEASHLGKQFVELPVQALRGKLHSLPPKGHAWTEEARTKFFHYMPQDSTTTKMKVVAAPTDTEPAEIELFIQRPDPANPEVDILASINQNLAIDTAIFEKTDENSKEEVVKPRIPDPKVLRTVNPHPKITSFPPSPLPKSSTFPPPHPPKSNNLPPSPITENGSSRPATQLESQDMQLSSSVKSLVPEPALEEISLCPPSIPAEGNFFNIRVTLAANPNKFVCQSYDDEKKLSSLMDEMQAFYNHEENLIEMVDCLIKVNSFYAGRNTETGLWCRICVKHIIKQQPHSSIKSMTQVSAYFVDFGDYRALFLEDLQPLYNSFRQLPFQAIHASLCGVTRLKRDWTPTECVAFKKLVVDKPLVGIVRGKVLDDNFPFLQAQELLLTLVDTTVEGKDIIVHEVLLESCASLSDP